MELLIYSGSTTDGYEYWIGFDEDNQSTGDCRQYRRKMGKLKELEG